MSARLRNTAWLALGGALLTACAGFLCWFPWARGLERLSFDLPFLFQRAAPSELVLVYVDAQVKAALNQPLDQPLDRRWHTRLLERLKQDGARLVLFDLLFDQPAADPATDVNFAAAMRAHGRVVLVAELVDSGQLNTMQETVIPPVRVLAEAAAGWGLARLKPVEPDFGVRRLYPGNETDAAATWVAAQQLGMMRPEADRLRPRWLNYYCPPEQLLAVNLDHAVAEMGLPAGFFRDKLVVVAARPSVGVAGAGRDTFANPYSRFGSRFSTGGEVHSFGLLNLLRGDWVERLGSSWELALFILLGLGLGGGLSWLSPLPAGFVTVAAVGLVAGVSIWMQVGHQVWWPWMVFTGIEAPTALVWSVGARYALEAKRRQRLRQAFAAYLSPHLAERIAETDFDLTPGGKQVDATVLFTDLDGFTSLAESLSPEAVSALLIDYFNETTRHIWQHEGTIIKFMGDAVQAVWGAPQPDPNQAERAVLAALGMNQAGQRSFQGRRLGTRIGIHSGPALAGNLGSSFRFDYAVIGTTTNIAARLETLNKRLGTRILLSEATRRQVGCQVRSRFLGRFLLRGLKEPVGVHELLGTGPVPAEHTGWLAAFARGMAAYDAGDLDRCEQAMREAQKLAPHPDGPAGFYLEQVALSQARASHGASAGDSQIAWSGVLVDS
jgi:adenylate cyclase